MTASQPMTRDELLEYAALDVFGLLDEYDAALYTRSFHHAPATVQDEIKRLQAELATDASLLTNVEAEPPAELRSRVLAAVAAAIEREESQLAPLATIGRRRPDEVDYPLRRSRWAITGLYWRAATFVFAAGAIVLAYAWSSAVRQSNEIAFLALNRGTEAELRERIGPDFAEFIKHANGRPITLRPTNTNSQSAGLATLFVKDGEGGTKSAFLVAMALPPLPQNQMYSLRVKVNGVIQDMRTFASNGVVLGLRLDNVAGAMLANAATWQVVDPAGVVVLASA